MSNFNPVALLVIALFTALAALTAPGAWLVGLVIGLGTVIVASFTGLRNDGTTPISPEIPTLAMEVVPFTPSPMAKRSWRC